jgi:hypothetical protein
MIMEGLANLLIPVGLLIGAVLINSTKTREDPENKNPMRTQLTLVCGGAGVISLVLWVINYL